MPGIDYRQLQAPEQVRTDLPDNGAALRAQELSGLFKEFEGISGNVSTQAQLQAGALAGAASGATGHPQYRQGLARFTAYSRAFNNAATGAYAVQAEAQADDAAARLRVQANNDPSTFRTTYSAVRDAVLKNAPAQAVPVLTELYNKRLAAGVAAISGDQAAQQQQLQRQTYDEGVARQISRVAELQGSDNPHDHLEAADEHTKLSLLIDGGITAGLYSKAEGQAMQINAMRTITAQVFETQVDRELSRADGGDVLKLLDNFRKAHEANLADTGAAPILSEPEYQKLFADATTKIREWNLTQAMNRREGKTAEQLRFEAGDQQYTAMLFDGSLTHRLLGSAVRSGDLKPETARALSGALENQTTAKTDVKAYARVVNDPDFLDMNPVDIAQTPGISTSDKKKLVDEQRRRLGSWENTQSVKDAQRSIDVALKIAPGTPTAALSDTERKARDASRQEFIQLMNDVDPAKRDGSAASVAEKVVKHAQQKQAAADATMYQIAKKRFQDQYGPGSPEPLGDKEYQTRVKHYDDLIGQSAAASKGE